MEKRLVLAIFLAVVFGVGVMSQGCEPDCSGMNAGDQVPDPKNCSQHYICLGDGLPSDHTVPCDPGNEFLEGGTSCTPADPNNPCTAICEKSTCHYSCNSSLDIIADPYDCSTYYICLPGGEVSLPYHCPDDRPVFDGVDCVKDKNKCCDDPCSPHCGAGVVQTPDPQDCHKYYICVEGEIDEIYHYECGEGEHFSITASHCVPGDTCDNLCFGSVPNTTPGGIGPTTAPGGGGTTTAPGGGGTTTAPGGGGTTTAPGGGGTTIPPTTATPATTTTPPAITTTSDCATSLTCVEEGYFAICHTCQPQYFHCLGSGTNGILMQCNGGMVFNTIPDYPYCVLPDNCPYDPPGRK